MRTIDDFSTVQHRDGTIEIHDTVDGEDVVLVRGIRPEELLLVAGLMEKVTSHVAATAGWFYFREAWGYPPGGMAEKLYVAIAVMDLDHLHRMSLGFPAEVAAYRLFSGVSGANTFLRLRAQGKV